MSAPASIATRLARVQQSIAAACAEAGRPRESVRLVAASKTRTADEVRAAVAAGQRLFGENRAQELRDKESALRFDPSPPEWHFIGALQSNKVRYVVGKASLIHSVDRFSIAEAIDRRAGLLTDRGELRGPVHVLIQVNIGAEASKAGVAPDAALEVAARVQALPHLQVDGLMCIPPPVERPAEAARWFEALAELAATGRAEGLELTELSMGMSHDHAVAVRCGATLVRVGTAIFGPRG
jgi:hypothetical protein